MRKVEYTEDGAIKGIKDNTAVVSFDWKKLVSEKSAEEGTVSRQGHGRHLQGVGLL